MGKGQVVVRRTKRFMLCIPAPMLAAIDAQAIVRGQSRSEFVREACRRMLRPETQGTGAQ